MVSLAETFNDPRHLALAEAVEAEILVHQVWCKQMNVILQRYIILMSSCQKLHFTE